MKYSIGDKVKIIKLTDFTGINEVEGCVGRVGKIVEIIEPKSLPYYIEFDEWESHYFGEDEIRLLTKLDKALK